MLKNVLNLNRAISFICLGLLLSTSVACPVLDTAYLDVNESGEDAGLLDGGADDVDGGAGVCLDEDGNLLQPGDVTPSSPPCGPACLCDPDGSGEIVCQEGVSRSPECGVCIDDDGNVLQPSEAVPGQNPCSDMDCYCDPAASGEIICVEGAADPDECNGECTVDGHIFEAGEIVPWKSCEGTTRCDADGSGELVYEGSDMDVACNTQCLLGDDTFDNGEIISQSDVCGGTTCFCDLHTVSCLSQDACSGICVTGEGQQLLPGQNFVTEGACSQFCECNAEGSGVLECVLTDDAMCG